MTAATTIPVDPPRPAHTGHGSPLADAVDGFLAAQRAFERPAGRSYWTVAAAAVALVDALAQARAAGCEPAAIAELVAPAREIFATAPLIRHIQTWPRGYAGDFEVVERILARDGLAEPGTFAAHLEHFMLDCAIAAQHRNKVTHQARLITHALTSRNSDPVRVMLIASSGAADLRSVPTQLIGPADRFVLHDIDRRALGLARAHLAPIEAQCSFVKGNPFIRIDELAAQGPFDLVLAGGLFDYLDDDAATTLVDLALTRLVAPGGILYFSNVSAGHHYSAMLDHLLGWKLIERDEPAMRALVRQGDVHLTVRPDPTRITLLAEVQRNP